MTRQEHLLYTLIRDVGQRFLTPEEMAKLVDFYLGILKDRGKKDVC